MSDIERCPSRRGQEARRETEDSRKLVEGLFSFSHQINSHIVRQGRNETTFLEFDLRGFDPNVLVQLAEEKGYSCIYTHRARSRSLPHHFVVSIPEVAVGEDIPLLVDDNPLTPEQIDSITRSLLADTFGNEVIPQQIEEEPKEVNYSLLSIAEDGGEIDYDFLEWEGDGDIIAHDKSSDSEIGKSVSKDIEVSNGLFDRIANGIVNFFSKKA